MSVLTGISEQGTRIIGFLRRAVKEGVSANRIQDFLKGTEYGYRRTTLLDDVRRIKGAQKQWSTLKYVRRDRTPTLKHYEIAKEPLKTNYQTVIEMRVTHRETGETATRHVTVGHDALKERGELEDIASSDLLDESPKWRIDKIMPTEARQCKFRW